MGMPSVPLIATISRDRAKGRTLGDAVLRYAVTAVCAGSAGVHAALTGPHFAEGGPASGSAFAVAAVALALAALAVRQPRHDSWAPAAAAAVLCLVAVGYLLSRTAGIPLLTGHAELLDPLGAVTTAAELAGAVAGAALLSRRDKA
jgi:hypothetical protein